MHCLAASFSRALLTVAATLALGPAPNAQEPAPAPLPLQHFQSLRDSLRELVGEGVVILRGAEQKPSKEVFTQDQEFWYLTGIAEPGLWMVCDTRTGQDTLFVPPFSRFTATWDGSRLAPGEEAAERTGFDVVGNIRSFLARDLDALLAEDEDGARPVVWTLLEAAPNVTSTDYDAAGAARRRSEDPFDGRSSREQAFAKALEERFSGLEIRGIRGTLNRMRAVKTDAEIAQIRAATQAAAEGIAEAMKSVEPGFYEYQLAAIARYVFTRLGAGPDSYAAIVGGGPNGCVLHYSALTRQLLADDLIVMDYGPTMHGYATDVTRTFPADGEFSDDERKLVQDVYDVQQELIRNVRPGATLGDLSRMCNQLLQDKGYRSFHGPCHHVGLAVHDVGGNVLQPGMVITVEPGAYLVDEGRGCRIEDVVLVTEDGCEVLSAGVPATPDEIEALMRADGVGQNDVGVK
ncbi:MAG: Xaa-Pro peptidase family protein [Planctomycetota bacterium]